MSSMQGVRFSGAASQITPHPNLPRKVGYSLWDLLKSTLEGRREDHSAMARSSSSQPLHRESCFTRGLFFPVFLECVYI